MRDYQKHLPVNWMDGMKINKTHFTAQDNAIKNGLQDAIALGLSPVRFGVLPPSSAGEDTFIVKTAYDNQNTLRVSILSCQAVTPGGARIILPAMAASSQMGNDHLPAVSLPLSTSASELLWWVVLVVNPYETQPAGSPDLADAPPRYPFVVPTYSIHLVSDAQLVQFRNHPYAITISKVLVNGGEIKVDDEYIPPCYSVNAHPDLLSLHAELDQFLSTLETRCSAIVQKIFRKSQQNELSELVSFICDRIMLYLAQTITHFRWSMAYEAPANMFSSISSLSRVMKNSIDLRTGTGKEELMNYLCEWCELKQGELETLLTSTSSMEYNHYDVNQSIQKIIRFVQVTGRLFDTLSKLDYIGKRKESGIFVKEEPMAVSADAGQQRARRRFFG